MAPLSSLPPPRRLALLQLQGAEGGVGGVPGQEPAREGGGLVALLYRHHGGPGVPVPWVGLYVLLSCEGNGANTG